MLTRPRARPALVAPGRCRRWTVLQLALVVSFSSSRFVCFLFPLALRGCARTLQ